MKIFLKLLLILPFFVRPVMALPAFCDSLSLKKQKGPAFRALLDVYCEESQSKNKYSDFLRSYREKSWGDVAWDSLELADFLELESLNTLKATYEDLPRFAFWEHLSDASNLGLLLNNRAFIGFLQRAAMCANGSSSYAVSTVLMEQLKLNAPLYFSQLLLEEARWKTQTREAPRGECEKSWRQSKLENPLIQANYSAIVELVPLAKELDEKLLQQMRDLHATYFRKKEFDDFRKFTLSTLK